MGKGQKKRILYVITKGNFGGAQRYVFDLATNLPKEDFETVVAFGEGDILGKKLAEKSIRTIRLKNSQRNINPFKDFLLFFELIRIYKKEKPNIIHLNSSKIGFLGSLSARIFYTLNPKPYTLVFTAHGWAFNDSKFFWQKLLWKFLQWLTVLMTNKTIAVSKKTVNDMNWPGTKKKIRLIYNGIRPIEFFEKDEARKKLLPQLKDRLWIGAISELHKNKGVDLLIEAFSKISNQFESAILIVCGKGEERKKLEKIIEKNNLKSKVFLLGYVENAQRYLKAFDIFVLPSRTEGLPYVILEAGLAGLPTLASEVGGIPEIIESGKNGLLFTPGEKEDLTKTLQDLLSEKGDWQKLGAELKKKILDEFRLENMVELTSSLYKI